MSEMRSRSVSNQKEYCTKSVHVQILYIIRVIHFLDAALFAVIALPLPDTSAICRSTSWVMVLVEALALFLVAGPSSLSSSSSISWETMGIILLMAGCK